MKKLALLLLVIKASALSAQVFWTENFGTGCNQGSLAGSYTGVNGSWTLSATGTNDPYANQWYVSAMEDFSAIGACSMTTCGASPNPTLHISNVAVTTPITYPADNGSTYNAGATCAAFSICVETNIRVESPTINCAGKNNLFLSFAYIENGDDAIDDASVWYNDGSTWSLLVNTNKTAECVSGMGLGIWTYFTVALPASANNNSNVRIGFNWTNNDDGVGTDPSFAVDSISLSQGLVTAVQQNNAAEAISIATVGDDFVVRSGQPFSIDGIIDLLGHQVPALIQDNKISLGTASGIYFIRLKTAGGTVIKKVMR